MQHFETHTASPDGDEVRIESLRGDPHIVAPVVMVREGVLNGGFLSFEEIERSVPGWNGEPVTAPPDEGTQAANVLPDGVEPSGHPMAGNDDGTVEFTSANQQPYLEDMAIGLIQQAEADPEIRGLRAEIWINAERAQAVGAHAVEVVKRIAEGNQLEVSTGYWHAFREQSGEFDGQAYDREQFDLLPDHLAMLPNETGACSWKDGCGAPRVNSEALAALNEALGTRVLAVNADDDPDQGDGDDAGTDPSNNAESTLDRIRRLVGFSDDDREGPRGAAAGNGSCECDGDADARTKDETHTETQQMNANYNIEALAESTAFDADTLRDMDESTLASLSETVEVLEPEGDDGDGEQTDADADGSDGAANEQIEALREEIGALREEIDAQKSDKKADLVESITSNSDLETDEIEDMSESALETLAEKVCECPTAQANAAPVGNRVNYLGQAGAAGDDGDDEIDDYTANIGALATMDGGDGA